MSEDNKRDVQQERAARKAARAEAREAQLATDLEYINEAEIQHGDENIATLEIPHTEGLPTMIAARAPKPAEVKRYRARLKGKDPDTAAAAEEVGRSCLVYPDEEAFKKIVALRAGVLSQLGAEALKLIVGRAEAEGKE